jgi:SAM-dependent methyltransferase
MHVFYDTLAPWWPLISPVNEYEGEMQEFIRLIESRLPSARTMLELGSGGGHNAHFLKRRYAMTLTDLSESMLAQSRQLNPECEHVVGDMRTLTLRREFDVVFAHDAIDYMTSESDLANTFRTAYQHLRPGGVLLCVPDHIRERFEPGTDWGGSDGPDGRSIRFLEWTPAMDRHATIGVTLYSFLAIDHDGKVYNFAEDHTFGVFPEATWVALLESEGFSVDVVDETGVEGKRTPRRVFVATRRGA